MTPTDPGPTPDSGVAPNPGHVALDRFRKQARALLNAAQSGDATALARVAAVPRLKAVAPEALAQAVLLADCQHIIAREVGAESWPKLKAALTALDPVAVASGQFLLLIADRQFDRARALLAAHPTLSGRNLFTAAATADLDALDGHLATAGGNPSPKYPHSHWTPLLYAAGSPLHADRPEGPERFTEVARRLIDAGADANEHTLWTDDDGKSRLTALYRAVVGNNIPLARLLLERGADPNDGESIYHGAELNRIPMLELLLAHGVEISRPDPHWGNTPLYFLAGHHEGAPTTVTAVLGMRWLLEHGADPNQPSGASGETPLHQLIRNHRGDDVLNLMLEHGADPNAPRKDGRTPYQMAVRLGHERAAKLLADRGADPNGITTLDRFLGAAMRGQIAEARRLLDADVVSIAELNAEDRGLLVQAANEENLATVDALIDLGFDLAWESEWGGTALHHAAWNGRLAMVEHLLAKGAPVNIRDHRFGSSPLAWAAHGSQNCRRADEDYVAVIDRLLAAGSEREPSINKWNEPPESMASPRVTGYLKKRLGLSGS